MEVKDMREQLKAANQAVPRSNEDVVAAYLAAQEIGLFDEQMAEAEAEAEKEENDDPVAEAAPRVPAGQDLNVSVKPDTESQAEIWTYVGTGDTPPHMINFMGMEQFMRGQAKEVSNPAVLAKLHGNQNFVQGEVTQETLFKNDEIAAKRAAEIRRRDQEFQLAMDRQNSKG